jgi:hypothetical protein
MASMDICVSVRAGSRAPHETKTVTFPVDVMAAAARGGKEKSKSQSEFPLLQDSKQVVYRHLVSQLGDSAAKKSARLLLLVAREHCVHHGVDGHKHAHDTTGSSEPAAASESSLSGSAPPPAAAAADPVSPRKHAHSAHKGPAHEHADMRTEVLLRNDADFAPLFAAHFAQQKASLGESSGDLHPVATIMVLTKSELDSRSKSGMLFLIAILLSAFLFGCFFVVVCFPRCGIPLYTVSTII